MGVGDQTMKIPHLRNMYDKVGAYAASGDQVSGFGFVHDGGVWDMDTFLEAPVFNLNNPQENQVNAFLMAVDTGVKPSVGQQISVDASNNNDAAVIARIGLLEAQDDAGNCALIVKGVIAGEPRGGQYLGSDIYWMDKNGLPTLSQADLRNEAATPGQEMLFTCTPLGTAGRMGMNRDEDSLLDGEDNCPAHVNDSQLDTDSDGLGDPCDPTPVPEPGALLVLLASIPLLRWMARHRA